MMDEPEKLENEPTDSEPEAERRWDTTSFLTGIALGAAVGAGLALLFAPAAGDETRRLVRSKAKAVTRDAGDTWVSAREDARRSIQEKKEALRRGLAKGFERLEDRLDG
jgi:gas vesicle protein